MRVLLLLLPIVCAAQPPSVRIYSEFRRIDPQGNIVEADRGGHPREILSPAAARNAFASFHLAVSVPPGRPFALHMAQNPEDAVKITLYREVHGQRGVPDRLEKAGLPVETQVPEGQTTLCYWLDLWVPADSKVGRIRVEAQLNVEDRWIIAPMEVRIREATVPPLTRSPGSPAPVEAPSDASVYGPWKAAVCGTPEKGDDAAPSIRSLIRRNALQDVALARVRNELVKEPWCLGQRPAGGPEWYLLIRDRLVR